MVSFECRYICNLSSLSYRQYWISCDHMCMYIKFVKRLFFKVQNFAGGVFEAFIVNIWSRLRASGFPVLSVRILVALQFSVYCRERGEVKTSLHLCASSRLKVYLFVHGFTVDTSTNGAESGLSLFRQVIYIRLDWTTPHFPRETYRDRSTSYFVHTFTPRRWWLQCTPKRRKEHTKWLNCSKKSAHRSHNKKLKGKNVFDVWTNLIPCFEVLTHICCESSSLH